jgi:phenylacetate-CoA oxygenase PaaI subunit
MDDATLAWADDAYVLGSQLASITGLYGPQLEENLAIGSFAQDFLGHARHLYLHLAGDDAGVDRLVFSRDAAAYRTSRLAGEWRDYDWAFVCTRGLTYALADTIRSASIAADPAHPLRDLATAIARDTAVHVEHWTEWLRALAAAGEAARLNAALASLWPLLDDFYADAGSLHQWERAMRAQCAEIGLQPPAIAVPKLQPRGRHSAALEALIGEANAVYRANPGVVLA